MSGRVSGAKLARLTKDFAEVWFRTKETWRDAKAQEFQRKYVDPLTESVNSAVTVMTELDKILSKIRSDCDE